MSFFLALNLLAMRSNIFFFPLNDVLLQAFTTTVVVAVVANAILNSGYSVPNAKEKCLRRIVSISAEMRKTAFGLLFGLSLPTLEFYELFFLILMFCPLRRWQNSWNSIIERPKQKQAKNTEIFNYFWCPCNSIEKRDIKPCKSSTSAICLVCRTNFAHVCVSVSVSLCVHK